MPQVLVDYSAPTPHNLDFSSVNADGTYKVTSDPTTWNWQYSADSSTSFSSNYPDGYDPYHGTCKAPQVNPCNKRLPGESAKNGCKFWKVRHS
jgi:hypothetical protein